MSTVTAETVRELLREEAAALQHADRDWNPLRTVPTGGRYVSMETITVLGGQPRCIAPARDTRNSLVVVNLGGAFCALTIGNYVPNNAAAGIPTGNFFPLAANAYVTIYTKAELWVTLSAADANCTFAYLETFD